MHSIIQRLHFLSVLNLKYTTSLHHGITFKCRMKSPQKLVPKLRALMSSGGRRHFYSDLVSRWTEQLNLYSAPLLPPSNDFFLVSMLMQHKWRRCVLPECWPPKVNLKFTLQTLAKIFPVNHVDLRVTHQYNAFWYKLTIVLKNWPTPAYFCLFSFFSTTNLQKNCRLQRESNSDRQSKRRTRWPLDHHTAHIVHFVALPLSASHKSMMTSQSPCFADIIHVLSRQVGGSVTRLQGFLIFGHLKQWKFSYRKKFQSRFKIYL